MSLSRGRPRREPSWLVAGLNQVSKPHTGELRCHRTDKSALTEEVGLGCPSRKVVLMAGARAANGLCVGQYTRGPRRCRWRPTRTADELPGTPWPVRTYGARCVVWGPLGATI